MTLLIDFVSDWLYVGCLFFESKEVKMYNLTKRIFLILLLVFMNNSYAADDGSKQSHTVWPISKFYFSVDFGFGIKDSAFQEVSGLDVVVQPIEYRSGNSKKFDPVKIPGTTNGNITLKKGVFHKDDQFFDWYTSIEMNTIKRKNITIKLLDESGTPTMIWVLQNAWPTKITGTAFKSDGNEVAVETIELVHEGLTIPNN